MLFGAGLYRTILFMDEKFSQLANIETKFSVGLGFGERKILEFSDR